MAFGVVSTARGQACETVTIEVLTDNFPGEIDWVLTGDPRAQRRHGVLQLGSKRAVVHLQLLP